MELGDLECGTKGFPWLKSKSQVFFSGLHNNQILISLTIRHNKYVSFEEACQNMTYLQKMRIIICSNLSNELEKCRLPRFDINK